MLWIFLYLLAGLITSICFAFYIRNDAEDNASSILIGSAIMFWPLFWFTFIIYFVSFVIGRFIFRMVSR